MATFRAIIEGVEDNIRVNDGSWSDWGDAQDVIEVYGPLEDEDIDEAEAVKVINLAIETDGGSLAEDLRNIQLRVMGQNFAGSWWNRSP